MTHRQLGANPPPGDPDASTRWEIDVRKGETQRQSIARDFTGPFARHSFVVGEAARHQMASLGDDRPGFIDYAYAIKDKVENSAGGDLETSSHLLMAQALSLDSIFTEYARLALVNIASHVDASDRFMRIALKAQANSRATIEALAKLHQPREQTVRHVHVNEGGQAVIADEFHHHAGGQRNAEATEQPHATGTGAASPSSALPGPNPIGETVSVAGSEGQPTMQDARRKGQRRASRKPQRMEARSTICGDERAEALARLDTIMKEGPDQ